MLTRAFLILLVTQTCFGMSFSAFFLLPKYLKLILAASDVQVGLVAAVGALSGVFAFPVVGALSDSFGRKPFIVAGTVIMTCTAAAMLFIDRVGPALYIARMLQGVAFAFLFNSATTLVTDKVEPRHLGRALAAFGASMLATNALSPAAAEWIAAHFGFRSVFAASTVFGLTSICCAPWIEEDGPPPRSSGPAPSVFALLKAPRARRIALLTATCGAGFGTLFTFHQPFAIALGMTQVAGFFVAYALCALSVRLLLLGRATLWSPQQLCAVSLGVYACAVGATAALRPGLLEVIGAVMGLAHGVFYPVFNAIAVQGVALSQRGSMMALYHGGFNAGTALALLSGGAIAKHCGYPALFLGVGFAIMVGAIVLHRSDLEPASV